jgi:hypothetical protein
MRFDTHLFISYGHVDNIETPDEAGWVTRFEKYLNSYLSAELGEQARIWRDEQLAGNGVFSNEIIDQLLRTAAVASVVSARYVDSGWCRREVETFCKAVEESGGLSVKNRMRVFQILLKPLKDEDRRKLPPALQQATGYPFYRELEGGRCERLDPSFGSPETYKARVARLAAEIAELIGLLRSTPGDATEGGDAPVVYLAECGRDRVEDRERLWAELRAHGCAVVPEQPSLFSDIESEYIAEASQLLARCDLAVHVVGQYPGKTPDGARRIPVVQLQNQLAAEQSALRGLPRLSWVPEQSGADEWSFRTDVQRLSELQLGADLITGGIEEFKSAVRAAVSKIRAAAAAAPTADEPTSGAGGRRVSVICLEHDIVDESVGPLVRFLDEQGIQWELPVFSGAASEVRAANEDIAHRCDAAILFCGAGEGPWIQSQTDAFTKVQAARRGRVPPLAFYLASPVTPDKQKLRWRKHAIDGFAGFAAPALEALLAALQPPAAPAAGAGHVTAALVEGHGVAHG